MTGLLVVKRAGPAATLQDCGRPGCLGLGLSASGPMDHAGFALAGSMLAGAGATGIEFTTGGIGLELRDGFIRVAGAGGNFLARRSGIALDWPFETELRPGDSLDIVAGPAGNFGYLRFSQEIDVPLVLGSRATNLRAELGGFLGRALRQGDEIGLGAERGRPVARPPESAPSGSIRFVWGLHAELFPPVLRERLPEVDFAATARMDRMGVCLDDLEAIFSSMSSLSLVSDVTRPGDIQILGDGTPVVLGRDHQPTGGYPRIGTVLPPDLDRLFQMRPGTRFRFEPIGLDRADRVLRVVGS